VIVLTAIVSIATFFGAFWLAGVGRIAADILATTQRAAAAMSDTALDDGMRETAMRSASLRLIVNLGSMFARSAAAFAAAVAPIALAHLAGLAQADRVFRFLSRWETAAATAAVAAVAYGIGMYPWRAS
jgi:hypothetical protein